MYFDEWIVKTYPDQGKRIDYMDKHYIPNTNLSILNFDDFIENRTQLLFDQLKSILSI